MSTLAKVSNKGGLTRTNPNRSSNLPMWSLIDDIFNRALPSVFSQNFNTGISLPMVNIKETSDAYFVEMAETIDDGKIEAKYNEGILSIYLPKKEEAKQKPARSIKIS